MSRFAFVITLQRVAQVIPNGIILSNLWLLFQLIYDRIHFIFQRLFEIKELKVIHRGKDIRLMFQDEAREALMKSTAVDGERFFVKTRFEKWRNTLCISHFSNRRIGGKAPSSAVGDFIRDSLVKKTF